MNLSVIRNAVKKMLPGLLLATLFVDPSFHLHAQEAKPAVSAGTASTPEA